MSMTPLYQLDKVSARNFFTFSDIYPNGKNIHDSTMTNIEIRRENARWLATQCGGPAIFAKRVGLSDSRVSQLIGKNPTKNIGSQTARKMEFAFEKPSGWLDTINAWAKEVGTDIATPDQVSAEDVARLIALFGKSTEDGRQQIMRMAESSEKTSSAN